MQLSGLHAAGQPAEVSKNTPAHIFSSAFLPFLAGRHMPVWMVFMLMAAAGLLAGYTLGISQQFSHDTRTSLQAVRLAGNDYKVLQSAAWARSPWS
jgi:hypothetical protein